MVLSKDYSIALDSMLRLKITTILNISILEAKVIVEKSRGEGSLIEQDTIENVSEPKFFF